jgi:superfamily I DNA/RNA helicase
MINFVLESFKNDPDLRYHYTEKFNYIMVDEYQDTNNAQNTIFDLILNTSLELSLTPNIMVV